MTQYMKQADRDNLDNFLQDEKLSYFSCTIFENRSGKEITSWCNNDEWIHIYNKSFLPNPPVKKHIVAKLNGLLWWDPDLYDKETVNFIKMRNEICNTKMICTLVPKYKQVFGAISFGSENGQNHLMNLIERNSSKNKLNELFNILLRCQS